MEVMNAKNIQTGEVNRATQAMAKMMGTDSAAAIKPLRPTVFSPCGNSSSDMTHAHTNPLEILHNLKVHCECQDSH